MAWHCCSIFAWRGRDALNNNHRNGKLFAWRHPQRAAIILRGIFMSISHLSRAALTCATLLTGFAPRLARAQPAILTERYDTNRTGANLAETILTPATVTTNGFGKLWSYPVSGSVQAQPLYVPGVATALGTRNLLIIATMNDIVSAFDADKSNATPVWSRALIHPRAGITPVPIIDITGADELNIVGNVGITSTPVIDPATGTLYAVARTKENGAYVTRLHAIDIASGAEKFGGPTTIAGSVPGTGWASVNGTLSFDPQIHNQRVSLALANGQVLIGFGSHEDYHAYHGWLMSYDAATLAQTGIFCTSPNGQQSAIWMAGHAPVIDSKGRVYVMTGNGSWDGITEFGESFLKFTAGHSGLTLTDWFTPDNYADLTNRDADLGSSGPLLIPGTDMIMGAGKDGLFYLLHTSAMGHEKAGNPQPIQILNNNGGEVKGGAVYWDRTGAAPSRLYVWTDATSARAYSFNGTRFDPKPVAQSLVQSGDGASNGVLTLSANGNSIGSGIVWSSMVAAGNGDHGVHHGVLRALDAETLKQLWSSDTNHQRDNAGDWPKFSPPVVVNGRVYLASFPVNGVSRSVVNVYGLLPH
jgi:hypothetical protein